MTQHICSQSLRIVLASAEHDSHARDLVIHEIGNGAVGLIGVIEFLAHKVVNTCEYIAGSHDAVLGALEEEITLYLDIEEAAA